MKEFTRNQKLLVAIILLALGLRLFLLFEKALGVDEAVTAAQLEMDWPGLVWDLMSEDAHPPLYIFLAKAPYSLAGIIAVKLVSVLAGIGIVYFSYCLFEKMFSEKAALIAAFLLAINPLAVAYSQHMRAYALFAFLFVVLLFQLQKFLEKKDRNTMLSITALNALLMYTHYHGFIVLVSELAFLLWIDRKAWKNVALVLAVSLLLFLPGVFFLFPGFGVVGGRTYAARSLLDLVYVFYKFAAGANISFLAGSMPLLFIAVPLILVLFSLGAFQIMKGKQKEFFFFLFWLPLLGTFAAAQLYSVLFYFRYFLYLLPLFVAPLALGISGIRDKRVRLGVLILVAAAWLALLVVYYGVIFQQDWNTLFGL